MRAAKWCVLRKRIMVPAEILDDFIAALQDIRETLKQQGE